MEIVSKSYVCQSATKFWVVALKNMGKVSFSCGIDAKLAVNLEIQDYQTLEFCQPPVMDQYYSIGLKLSGFNATSKQKKMQQFSSKFLEEQKR